jgi:hypothetical protein
MIIKIDACKIGLQQKNQDVYLRLWQPQRKQIETIYENQFKINQILNDEVK